MDAFGWSTQPPAAPSCPSDDALLDAFLGASGFELHSDGCDAIVSSDAYGLGLPSCQHGPSLLHYHDGVALPGDASTAFLDSVGGLLPVIAGAAHDGILDGFAFPDVGREEPVQAAGSNAAFSGYSTTTGGGNISSGESNTCGGHDTEVASPCAVSGSALPQTTLPPSEREPSATTTTEEADGWWRTKRAAATTTTTATSITFGQSGGQAASPLGRGYEPDTEAIAQVKEMIYRAAAMRPVNPREPASAPELSNRRRRKNVLISSDPQTVAARLRRERVSERLRALQRLVPGGSKMDTASMLDEAASYLRFLKSQLEALETLGNNGRLLQRYMGRDPSRASNSTVLAFGRDGVTGYVKSNRNMQL